MTEALPPSFTGALGLEMWVEDGFTHGRAEVRPEMLAADHGHLRMGVLATLIDVVTGTLPEGAINPTVDLRLWLLSPSPSSGDIHLVCKIAKMGNRLVVSETTVDAGDPDRPFCRSTVTFMNRPIPDYQNTWSSTLAPLGASSFDDAMRLRFPDERTVEMDLHDLVHNPVARSIQGGAQILMAEIAAEHALRPRGEFRVVDLEIRFLNKVRTDTVSAIGEVQPGEMDGVTVRVPIMEVGADARIVSLVSARCRDFSVG